MSTYRIIYPNDDGISIIVPAPGISLEKAIQDVPAGKPYFIVNAANIPADRTFRNAWTADFSNAPIKE